MCARPMRPRRGVSPACSMSSARSCRCCARPPIRRSAALQGVVARRMHAAVAPFAADRFITPMAAVAGSRRGRNSWRDAGRSAARSRLCQQWRRHRAASDRRRAVHRRPDGPAGRARPDAHDDRRCRRSRRAASRPAAATAAVSRSALPMPSRCWRGPPRRPMPPPPSLPMPSICPGIPPIIRCPANELQPDSDLGARLVTRDVGRVVGTRDRGGAGGGRRTARGNCSPPD